MSIDRLINVPLRFPPPRPAAIATGERKLSVDQVPQHSIQIAAPDFVGGDELMNVPLRPPPSRPALITGTSLSDKASSNGSGEY